MKCVVTITLEELGKILVPGLPSGISEATYSLSANSLVIEWNCPSGLADPLGHVTTPGQPKFTPGHAVVGEPPYSVTGQSTVFGLNWDGTRDPSDNGVGFFTDPKTGEPYDTKNKDLIGVSLPREVLLATFLSVDVKDRIETAWDVHASALRSFVLIKQPLVTVDSGGHSILNAPIVDAGPAKWTGNVIDLTYGAAHALDTKGKALATYEIRLASVAQQIKGV